MDTNQWNPWLLRGLNCLVMGFLYYLAITVFRVFQGTPVLTALQSPTLGILIFGLVTTAIKPDVRKLDVVTLVNKLTGTRPEQSGDH